MPTHDETDQFRRDYESLGPDERAAFKRAVKKFIEDLRAGVPFRASLRVMSMRGAPGVFEMTWEGEDGRATFQFGEQQVEGETHVTWRRIGGHGIYGRP